MDRVGQVLYAHVAALFPIYRSITGAGLRETLRYIGDRIPLQIHEVPSGTRVLDWEIPLEWTIRGGSIRTMDGRDLVDFRNNTLHAVQYSVPVKRVVAVTELQSHLHSLPGYPEYIPYRTSYYERDWGFCLTDRDRQALTDDTYHVLVDSTLEEGSLSYGECFLPGRSSQEVLISAHCCHPALANDNLSAVAVAIELARFLAGQQRRLSYRFVFAPGTIGAIAWLHFNRDAAERVSHGVVLTCLGNRAPLSYKRSRRETTAIDRYAGYLLASRGDADRVLPFTPAGGDERQFCSPGFDLPVGCLTRSPDGSPEYHTSADDLSFVVPEVLADSLAFLRDLIQVIESDACFLNLSPYGEPHLRRRGLLGTGSQERLALSWVLSLSDGRHTLFDIAQRSGIPFDAILASASALQKVGLLGIADAVTDGNSRGPLAGPEQRLAERASSADAEA